MSVSCIVMDHHHLPFKSENYIFTYTENSISWLNHGQKESAILLTHLLYTYSPQTNKYFGRVLKIQETAYAECDIS